MALDPNNTKEFTGGFTNKTLWDWNDRVAGTSANGTPIKTTVSNFMASITKWMNGYMFRGVAVPSTNPTAQTHDDIQICYIASVDGTYTHFNNLHLDNEVAILKYTYAGDWMKETVFVKSVGIEDDEFIDDILYLIGVPKVQFINPTVPQQSSATTFVAWINNTWTWKYKSTVNSLDYGIFLDVGTKVLCNGVYYVLENGGMYTEEERFVLQNIIKKNISVLNVSMLNPSVGFEPADLPYVKYAGGHGGSWRYYYKGGTTDFILLNDETTIQLGTIESPSSRKWTFKLYTDSPDPHLETQSPKHLFDLNFDNARFGDTFFISKRQIGTCDLGDVLLILKTKGILQTVIRFLFVDIKSNQVGFIIPGFTGSIEFFCTQDTDEWYMLICGIDKNNSPIHMLEEL